MLRYLLCICVAFCATATWSNPKAAPNGTSRMEMAGHRRSKEEIACKVSPLDENQKSMVCNSIHPDERAEVYVASLLSHRINQLKKDPLYDVRKNTFLDCFLMLMALSSHIPRGSARIFIEDCIKQLEANQWIFKVSPDNCKEIRKFMSDWEYYRDVFEGERVPNIDNFTSRLAELESESNPICSPDPLLDNIYAQYGITECVRKDENFCVAKEHILTALGKTPQQSAKQFIKGLESAKSSEVGSIDRYFAFAAITLPDSDSFAIKLIKKEMSDSLNSGNMSELVSKTIEFRELFRSIVTGGVPNELIIWLQRKAQSGHTFWKDVNAYITKIAGEENAKSKI